MDSKISSGEGLEVVLEDETTIGSVSRVVRERLLLLVSSAASSSEEDDVETMEGVRCLLRIAILRLRANAASFVAVAMAKIAEVC